MIEIAKEATKYWKFLWFNDLNRKIGFQALISIANCKVRIAAVKHLLVFYMCD